MNTRKCPPRSWRMTPLARCLSSALALVAGSATATVGPPPDRPPAWSQATADNGGAAARPSWWRTANPTEIAQAWAPAPHTLPTVPAASIVVQNCNDDGAGSLRDALDNAASGDTIDLTQLTCSTISLSGPLVFFENSITLQGPGSKYLSIDGGDASAPLLHEGAGTLYINDLSIEHGAKYFTSAQIDDARGGCVFSTGEVFVSDSTIAYCTANNTSATYTAKGGAIYAATGVTLSNSNVVNSSAVAAIQALGGGIYTPGFVDISDSFVSGNSTSGDGGGVTAMHGLIVKYSTIQSNSADAYGGGLYGRGNITITNSTIAANQAGVGRAGMSFRGFDATLPITLLSSTVSGNEAQRDTGMFIANYAARIANSTIAFNYEHSSSKYGAGVFIDDTTVDMESSIVGANSYGGGTSPDDVGGTDNAVISGANNLIGFSSVPPPSGTIELESPMLGPLAFNGGTTRTHMLLSGSPAIDAGNDGANVSFDQRGSGYPRIIGLSADIGAYELDTSDVIFVNGFDA